MIFSLESAYFYTKLFTVVVFTIQFIEYFNLRNFLTEKGVWSFKNTESFFPLKSRHSLKILGFLIKYPNIIALLSFRQTLILFSLFLFKPLIFFLIIISSLLILSRWRGNFNGGSDAMSLILIVGLFFGALGKGTSWEHLGLIYIAIHVCISYFKAGWVKILKPEWRKGSVLNLIIQSSPYPYPLGFFSFIVKPPYAPLICVSILFFELSFPLALINPSLCLIYIFFGFLFHAMIIYIFGLNRFFWSWLATYPSLFYTSLFVSHI